MLSPGGLSRSNTTTGGSPSLSPQTIYMVRAHARQEELTDSAPSTTPGSSLRPRPSSKISKISEESSIDTPRGSFDDGDDEWMAGEDDGEPQWEMVTSGGKIPDEPMSEGSFDPLVFFPPVFTHSLSSPPLFYDTWLTFPH